MQVLTLVLLMCLMAKAKQIELKDCTKCSNSETKDNITYCKLRIFDNGLFTDYAKVLKVDCIWWKNIKGIK